MDQSIQKAGYWKFARKGWWLSIILALILLLASFKDIIFSLLKVPDTLDKLASAAPFWQAVVKTGITDNIASAVDNLLPFAVLISGGLIFLYAVVSGYRRTYQALEFNSNDANGLKLSAGDITLGNIAARSLLINVPILYWAIFLFMVLPWLAKLPIASISSGSISVLVAVCIFMVVITVVATHLGLLMARLSLRFIIPHNHLKQPSV